MRPRKVQWRVGVHHFTSLRWRRFRGLEKYLGGGCGNSIVLCSNVGEMIHVEYVDMTHLHRHIHAWHPRIHAYMETNIHAYIIMIHACIHTCRHTDMHTQLRTYAATHIHNNKPTNRDTYYIHMLSIYICIMYCIIICYYNILYCILYSIILCCRIMLYHIIL